MIISPARLLDVADIIALFDAEPDVTGKMSWYRFQHYRRRTEQWDKIEDKGKILGFVHWAMKTDNTRTIYDLVVHPDHRRRGIGTKLVNHVGTPALVRTASAQRFFEKLGFVNQQAVDRRKTMLYLGKEPFVVNNDKPWIMTYTGKVVNPLDVKPDDICIQDIAHALACVNRFAGHTAKPLSVAQHSVLVSKLAVSDTGCPPALASKIALQGLLHDASEAYLGDMTKWLKAAMPVYCEAEERLQQVIFEKFNLPQGNLHPAVERADRVMVMFEASKGFGNAWDGKHLNSRPGYEPITQEELTIIGKWAPLPWRAAEDAFLVRYRACTTK